MTHARHVRRAAHGRRSRPWTPALWAFALALPAVLDACGAVSSARPDGLYARIHTARGTIVARLEPERTPLAAASFVGLAEGTIENAALDPGRPFYDGSVFHRVVPGHVIQAGAPATERADGPGYEFPNQIHAALSHDHAGALGVANAGPHTNGAQFYITLGDRSYLDGDYIVFGNVVEGMDVVERIVRDDVIDSVRIVRIGERAEAFRPDTERFREMVRAEERRVAAVAARKRAAERAWIARNWPDAVEDGSALRDWPNADLPDGGVLVVEAGPGVGAGAGGAAGDGPRTGPDDALRVRYRGTAVRYMRHLLGYDGPEFELTPFGSGTDGQPGHVDPPRTFTFEPGETTITPGFDATIATMAPGERRVVVVPPGIAYGPSGFYAPPTPGARRLVISPNSPLVYEIEVLAADRDGTPPTGDR